VLFGCNNNNWWWVIIIAIVIILLLNNDGCGCESNCNGCNNGCC